MRLSQSDRTDHENLRVIAITVAMLTVAPLVAAAEDDLPAAIACYQAGANTKDIDAYMNRFTPDAEMLDASRTFNGHDAIRAWALRKLSPPATPFATATSRNPRPATPKPKCSG